MSVKTMTGRVFYNGLDINSTLIAYNATLAGGTGIGWKRCRHDHVVVQTGVPQLARAGTTVTFRIEGKFTALDRAASVQVIQYTDATEFDDLYEITERFEYVRIGFKLSAAEASPLVVAASPIVINAGVCLTAIGG